MDDLANEIVLNGLEKDYQILLRRCPVDISRRFESIIKKHTTLIKQAPPLWNFEPNSNWTTIYPLPEDVKLLVSTVYYSEIVVNLGSTMAFDFAMFKKPCIYINYDQEIKVNPNWSVNWIYELQPFRSMLDKNAVIWINNKNEIKDKIILNQSSHQLELWKETVLSNYKTSSESIKSVLKL